MRDFFLNLIHKISEFFGDKTRAMGLLGSGGVGVSQLWANIPDTLATLSTVGGVALAFMSVVHEAAKAYKTVQEANAIKRQSLSGHSTNIEPNHKDNQRSNNEDNKHKS